VRISFWRIGAAVLILALLAAVLGVLAPVYFRNLQFQHYVGQLTRISSLQAASDENIRTLVLQKAQQLALPVLAKDVQIQRLPDGRLQRVKVRYFIRTGFPGYTVDVHF
jgi:hypothetical protein